MNTSTAAVRGAMNSAVLGTRAAAPSITRSAGILRPPSQLAAKALAPAPPHNLLLQPQARAFGFKRFSEDELKRPAAADAGSLTAKKVFKRRKTVREELREERDKAVAKQTEALKKMGVSDSITWRDLDAVATILSFAYPKQDPFGLARVRVLKLLKELPKVTPVADGFPDTEDLTADRQTAEKALSKPGAFEDLLTRWRKLYEDGPKQNEIRENSFARGEGGQNQDD